MYSSSAAVYGPQSQMPIKEDAPLCPESPYGLSKMQGEQQLAWMARQHGWSAVSLRYFNPVGAHPSGCIGEPFAQAASLVPRALKALPGPGPVHSDEPSSAWLCAHGDVARARFGIC